MTSLARKIGVTLGALAALSLLSGCSVGGTACPAIGYFHTLTVQRGAGLATDSSLQVCLEGDCLSSANASVESSNSITTEGTTGWKAILTTAPKTVDLRAQDAAGATVASRTVTPNWVRVGGSAACGGPMAATVTFGP